MSNTLTLREARELTGLSQRAFARFAGVKFSAVADVEGGRIAKPSHDFVTRVMRALHRRGLEGIAVEQVFPVPEGDPSEVATS